MSTPAPPFFKGVAIQAFFDTVIRYVRMSADWRPLFFRHGYPLVRMSADWRPLCPPVAQANACAQGRTIKFFTYLLAFQKILLTFAVETKQYGLYEKSSSFFSSQR